ncbi:formimidoylglutamate deiminase [Streptomyces xinghaiensis]|uniref:formimidoylglutamate deiminase n=1 Tax=Streptomyces xinghaiensis TaxID=1038928 RepID=UPI00378FAF2C
MPLTYWAEYAWLDGTVAAGVTITAGADGRIAGVGTTGTGTTGTTGSSATGATGITGTPQPPPGAVVLRGLTLPGLANAHSHAFHRALRGRAQTGHGNGHGTGSGSGDGGAPRSFWAWRDVMYRAAARLTPDGYHALARAVYAEMALAGITCAGEFHYLHHAPGGTRYAEPNVMGEALIAAAAEAGIRLTLLDTAYLAAGFPEGTGGAGRTGRPLEGPQLRFGDGTAEAWAERAAALKPADHARIGAAVHSVRAVPAAGLPVVAAWARERGAPLHVHLSEQTAENDACRRAHGCTPARLLADHGVLGPDTTAVHATHLTAGDIGLLGGSRTGVCMCPTTERDLADGIGPAVRLRDAGSRLSLGSDSHAVIDLLEEARAMELDERLTSRTRGHWTAAQLLRAAGADGHAALGWPEAGRIAPGAFADLTTVALDTVRTAGPPPRLAAEAAVFAATAADVRHTVVGGREIVRDGAHLLVDDVPRALAESVAALLDADGG